MGTRRDRFGFACGYVEVAIDESLQLGELGIGEIVLADTDIKLLDLPVGSILPSGEPM